MEQYSGAMGRSGALRGHPAQLVRGRLLDIDLLHVFVTVTLCGGLTSAAQVLHRTQAAVSLQIKRLEEIAGAQLLIRSSRGAKLTSEGKTLFSYAQKMLAINEEAMLSLHSDSVSGPVRIDTYHHFASSVLPDILAEFADLYPDVWVEIHVGLAASMSSRGTDGSDLIIGLDEQAADHSIVIAREAVSWYTSLDRSPHLRDPLPIAVLPEGSLFRRWAIDSLSREGRPWRIAQVCTNAAAVEAAVAAGLAIGVFKEGTVTSPRLKALSAADGFPSLPSVDVNIRTSGVPVSIAARKLRDFIVERLVVDPVGDRSVP